MADWSERAGSLAGNFDMAEPLLRLQNVRKKFGGLVVTDDVTIDVGPGEFHAVIGPNGAGKTTLLNLISGLLRPDAGRIRLAGRDITGLSVHMRARLGLARSFQVTSVVGGFSVLENVALAIQSRSGSSFRFSGEVAEEADLNDEALIVLAQVGLAEVAAKPAHQLSHGENRALEIAIALAVKPNVLLLDEPMAGTGRDEAAR